MRFKTSFVQHDPVKKICAAAAEAVSLDLIENVHFAHAAESPIEEVFATAIYAHYAYIIRDPDRFKIYPQEQFDKRCEELAIRPLDRFEEYDVLGASQYQSESPDARVDFIFAHKNWRTGKVFRLVVECDGHNFHERTKEQAERDRSRDRMFQEKGWGIFRFTGSEIWKDPMGCAYQVADWLDCKSSGK